MDSFGLLVMKYRTLLEKRDTLVSQIQASPGFGDFVKVPLFDNLSSAASRGPVIVVNHNKWRSDIIIILHRSLPSLIATPMTSTIVRTASVLADLYKLVGKPVIDRLHELNIPEQSESGGVPLPFFIRFLSTPWVRFQLRIVTSFDRPSLLLIAQPDPSLPKVGGEIEVIQALNTQVTSLISENATLGAVVDQLRNHRFVHFACHGTLESGKPFDAAFELCRDERLTLLEIVRSHLPTAEFAFLSACHTAELTEESIADEVLHLAAAVQYCGFRSVVGTMWAMVDEDGQDLAKHFYRSMFSGRERALPYYERSAKALRDAVRKLRRKKRISLERWVNFVHYGA
ncbi:CHAT domain-containing protein [Lactarius quietus]|nr:CHAT domain-containing protein [Lactarius quietus]